MRIDLCDNGHRAVAFLGTCPICYSLALRRPDIPLPPAQEGHTEPFVRQLDAALAVAYGAKLER
jgi:hypothetical protein